MPKQADPSTVAYWRGTVDSRLDNFSTKLDDVCARVTNVELIVTRMERQLGNGGKFIEWEFIREKFMVPIILAAITFILFTVMPTIFIIIYIVLGDTP